MEGESIVECRSEGDQSYKDIYTNAIVIDGLAGTTFAFENLMDAGLTAAHVTVAAHNEPFAKAIEFIKDYYAALDVYDDKMMLIRCAEDILQAKEKGKLGIILGFQTVSPVEEDLTNIRVFYELGVRVMQLTYMGRNLAGYGCYEPHDQGLTYYGMQIIRELNRIGIVMDLSHVGWRTAMEAVSMSKAPVILSHSNPYRMCSNRRNVSDELIQAVAQTGGCIGANAHPGLCERKPGVRPTIEDYLDIIDYLVDLVGIDHVGLGTDMFEGFQPWQHRRWARRYDELQNLWGTTEGFGVASDMPNVVIGLQQRGYQPEEIEKVLGGNLLRVFRETWGSCRE